MSRPLTLKNLKPGTIFKLVDNLNYEVDTYVKKGAPPKRVNRKFYLEEWHAVVEGEYPVRNLTTILFKQIKNDDGKDRAEIKDGEFKVMTLPKDIYDSEPPTSIEVIEGKELRMIVSPEGLRAKLVDKK